MDFEALTQKKKEIPFKVKNNIVNFKELDEDNRIIKAVANTFNYFDYDFDSLDATAANRSISDNGATSKSEAKIAHLLHHNMTRPVGKSMKESVETIDGKKVLYVESFIPETFDGDDTIIKYNTGIYNQHSIGFNYKVLTFLEKGTDGWDDFVKNLINPEDADEVGYGWKVSEIELWEYSTVVFGANKLTPYLGAKNQNKSEKLGTIFQKLTILANKAQKREIKNKRILDFEVSQLKQMILEITEDDSQPKGAQSDPPGVSAQQKVKLKGFSSLIKI